MLNRFLILILLVCGGYWFFSRNERSSLEGEVSAASNTVKVIEEHRQIEASNAAPLVPVPAKAEVKPTVAPLAEELFDEEKIQDYFKATFAGLEPVELMDETDDKKVWLLEDHNGFQVKRTEYKDVSWIDEEWITEDGAQVMRRLSDDRNGDISYIDYKDKYNNRFDMAYNGSGQLIQKFRVNSDGSGTMYTYYESGELEDVWEKGAGEAEFKRLKR